MNSLLVNAKNCLIVIGMTLFSATLSFADDGRDEPYHWPLRDLREPDQVATLDAHPAALTVAVLFQPDCSWCEKQIHELNHLVERCPAAVQPVLVGVRADATQLRRELQHYPMLPALQASTGFLRRVQAGDVTPVMLFFDQDGNLMAKRQGYLALERLHVIVDPLITKQCPHSS